MTSQSKVRDLVITGISTKFPDRYLSQYANNQSPYAHSTTEQNRFSSQSSGCFFDPHCAECIRELWGPLLSPFAYLIKQNAQYFNEILMRIGQYKVNTTTKDSSSKPLPKPPKLEYEDHKFLTGSGICAYYGANVGWLITWTLGFLLLILAIAMIALNDPFVPPLIVILRMNEASKWGMKFTLQIVFIIISLIGINKMFASALGLFGTTHRTEKLMSGSLIIIGILVLLETAAIIYCVVRWSQLVSGVELALRHSFQTFYGSTNKNQVTNAWDRIFQNYECCGWLGNDFTSTPWLPSTPNAIPYSCCRPGAPHPGCESTSAPSGQNYASQQCRSAIQKKLYSFVYVLVTCLSIGIIIIVEIATPILTYLYSLTLNSARRRRRHRNEKIMQKFQERLASYTQETTDDTPSDLNQTLPREDQAGIDDLRQLYNQYTAFHKTPPDIDPSLMSITPTVIQVKRPNIYSYFYYE